ncbi:MAG: ATP-binding cassette domain-containing protein [Byssovorax sp.]
MTEPLLAARALSVSLGGRPVLQRVSLAVSPGEVLGVFGPSGAGKSTLFRALAGEEQPAAGSVLLDGEDVTKKPLFSRARKGLGYLPQTPSVLWDLTVLDNLRVYLSLAPGAAPVEPQALAAELGLGGRLDVRASALSGGERRRLELARALAGSPRVLLCDEPFAALDPQGARRVGEHLAALAGRGGAVLIADHHVSEALGLCHRAALLVEGEIALVTDPASFRGDPLVQRHYAALVP